MSQCSKPACSASGGVVLGYDYAARVVILEDPPEGMVSPHVYVLCVDHADRLTLPHGWTLDDNRTLPVPFADAVSMIGPSLHDDLSESGGQVFFGTSV